MLSFKRQHIVVFGFGAQGSAQAQNLHDGGYRVTVFLRPKSKHLAEVKRLHIPVITDPKKAAQEADIAVVLIPDTEQPAFWKKYLAPHLQKGTTVIFAHGYSIHYQHIPLRDNLNIMLVAPMAQAEELRSNFLEHRGTPCLIATAHAATKDAKKIATTYATAIAGNGPFMTTTVAEEVETDLFAEQAVLCGGIPLLVQNAFETLVEKGYNKTVARFCCLKELSWLGPMIAKDGINGLQKKISTVAQYGAKTRGPRIIGPQVRTEMKKILEEIRDGTFAKELL